MLVVCVHLETPSMFWQQCRVSCESHEYDQLRVRECATPKRPAKAKKFNSLDVIPSNTLKLK